MGERERERENDEGDEGSGMRTGYWLRRGWGIWREREREREAYDGMRLSV